MESAAGRFSRLDKAVAELTQRTGQLDKEISAVKGWTEVGFGALRTRPGQSEISDALAKIVDAASSDVTAHLGSLEETVLTLAEALLRPHGRQIPAPREGNRI